MFRIFKILKTITEIEALKKEKSTRLPAQCNHLLIPPENNVIELQAYRRGWRQLIGQRDRDLNVFFLVAFSPQHCLLNKHYNH